MIKVFFLEPTDRQSRSLRRYKNSTDKCLSSGIGYCNAHTPLPDCPVSTPSVSFGNAEKAKAFSNKWPTHCTCGYAFTDDDDWQLFTKLIYRRTDTGDEMSLNDAPAGACWNASWMVERRKTGEYMGPDGRCLVVRTPGGDWMIDSRCSNCTMKEDTVHKCWVRHGSPEEGTLHVDKNGYTCAAGGGSIICGSYHGFLHNGFLISC